MNTRCEIFTRTVGYIRPRENMHNAKQDEVHDRHVFDKDISHVEQTRLRLK